MSALYFLPDLSSHSSLHRSLYSSHSSSQPVLTPARLTHPWFRDLHWLFCLPRYLQGWPLPPSSLCSHLLSERGLPWLSHFQSQSAPSPPQHTQCRSPSSCAGFVHSTHFLTFYIICLFTASSVCLPHPTRMYISQRCFVCLCFSFVHCCIAKGLQ